MRVEAMGAVGLDLKGAELPEDAAKLDLHAVEVAIAL